MDGITALRRLIEIEGTIIAAATRLGTAESNLRYWIECDRVPAWREGHIIDAVKKLEAA